MGGREDILGQNSSVHDNITTTPDIQTSKAAELQMPFTVQSSVWSFFMWGVSFDTKRSNSKELSFCTQKHIDGNHIKLGSRAYSQAWYSI